MARTIYDQNIVIDLEFTPSGYDGCLVTPKRFQEIIEIGAVRVSSDGHMLDEFRCLVKPQYVEAISLGVSRITGLNARMLEGAPTFREALRLLSDWVGNGRTRMVAWSENDEAQMISECTAKGLELPANMTRWLDLQRVFPRAMDMRSRRKCMSLHDAFAWFDRELSHGNEHRALADAEHTAELLVALMHGEHLEHKKALKTALVAPDKERGYNVMAGALAGLYAQMCAVA